MSATVTIVRPLGNDSHGDPIAGVPERITVDGAFVAPRQNPETEAGVHDTARQAVIVGLTLYAPFGTDLRHDDVVEVAGPWAGTYEVEGEPGRWRSAFSDWEPGLEVALRRAVG